MNSKIKFYQTIHFKIALVFALMLMLTLEVVGAVFVRQLEQENLNTFKQQIELPTYVDSSLAKQLSRTNEKAANRQIKQILSEVKNNNISEIRVVDAKGIVRGTSNASNQDVVGQRTTDEAVKNTLLNNRSHTEKHIRQLQSQPLLCQRHSLVAQRPIRRGRRLSCGPNLESVYDSVNGIH